VGGKLYSMLKGDRVVEEFQEILNGYVEKRYGNVLVEA
jgi:(E)-4-hydroxy-3-methylbut-2-enyl-diphosphate synthase